MSENLSENLDYTVLFEKYPWVIQSKQNCILSPDSDGLLCGLLMSHYLGWRVCGFYDGKVLVVEQETNPQDCVFLDMEIFRSNIRSIGQHMIMYDKKNSPANRNLDQCISANNMRGYDFKNNFKQKYPFGTIHLLLSILGQVKSITIPKSAVSILLYTDGTFKNQFNYPENCLSWLDFLNMQGVNNPLQKVFLNKYSTHELMVELRSLFSDITLIGGGKRGGDKIKISDSQGNIANIDSGTRKLNQETKQQAERFIKMLAMKTQWNFLSDHWSWGPYRITQFEKDSTKPTKARYNNLLAKHPVSLAIISRNNIEYTIDENGDLE